MLFRQSKKKNSLVFLYEQKLVNLLFKREISPRNFSFFILTLYETNTDMMMLIYSQNNKLNPYDE